MITKDKTFCIIWSNLIANTSKLSLALNVFLQTVSKAVWTRWERKNDSKCLLLSRWGTVYGHLEQGLQSFLSAIWYFEKVWLAICLTYWYSNKTDIADNQYSTSDENRGVVRLPCCRNNLCQFFESFAVLFHLLLILKCSCCSLLVYSLLWGSHICNLSQLMLLKTWPYQKKVL